jgi:hypothetical protein
MEPRMPTLLSRELGLIAVSCLIIGGCGAKPTGAAPEASASTSAAAPATAPAAAQGDASAADGAPFDCTQHAGGGTDYQLQSAAYLFIGDHPMCTDKAKVQEFCASLKTREGFLLAESANAGAEGAEQIAASLPEESRSAFMLQHPKHAFEQGMEKCGLKVDDVRSQLVAEAEAAIKAGSKTDASGDVHFLVHQAPAKAEALWARECAGHLIEKTQGEGTDWDFNGTASYTVFCKSATNYDSKPIKFDAPAASKGSGGKQ